MSNKFLTVQEIARAALPILHDNLVFPALTYRNSTSEYNKKGDVVQVRKPPMYTADEFDGEINLQDVNEENVLVTLDKIADVSVELTAKEMALNLSDFTKQVLEPAAVAIAEKINRDGLALYRDIPYVCGEAGTTPSGIGAFAQAAKVLNDNKAPLTDRACIWNSTALAEFQSDANIVNAEKCGSTKALRNGAIGKLIGFDNYTSHQICNHTKGSANGALSVKTDAEAGAEMISVSCESGTLVKGDIIAVKGNTYTVKNDTTADGGVMSVNIYPAVPAEGFAAGEEITLTESHTANLAFHKNAFGFISRPLEKARGAESYVTSYNGITLRVTFGYDIATKKQTMSVDTLYGFKTLYPELAVRVLG